MEWVSKERLADIVEAKLAELGSPLPFTSHREWRVDRKTGCNWSITVGPVGRTENLPEHGETCRAAWEEFRKEYNLEPEKKGGEG